MEVLLKLITREAEIHFAQQEEREGKFKNGHTEGQSFNEFVIVPAKDEKREGAYGWNQDEAREQAREDHSPPPATARIAGQKMMMSTASAPTTTHTA